MVFPKKVVFLPMCWTKNFRYLKWRNPEPEIYGYFVLGGGFSLTVHTPYPYSLLYHGEVSSILGT